VGGALLWRVGLVLVGLLLVVRVPFRGEEESYVYGSCVAGESLGVVWARREEEEGPPVRRAFRDTPQTRSEEDEWVDSV
jgi:hypothetical protein